MSVFDERRIPHWTTIVATLQGIISLIVIVLSLSHLHSEDALEQRWTYVSALSITSIATVVICLAFSRENLLRGAAAASSVILITFLAPLTLVTTAYSLSTALLLGMIFVMLIISTTPMHVACLAFITGGFFAYFFNILTETSIENTYRPLIAFLIMSAIALLWRALLMKLLMGYIHLQFQDDDDDDTELLNGRILELEGERTLLREEIITHVIELNNAVLTQQADPQEGQ